MDPDLDAAEPWLLDAACRGLDRRIFFPDISEDSGHLDQHRRPEYDQARAICATCPVVPECLEAELRFGRFNQYGVRGGLEPWERRRIIGRRQKARWRAG